jgi:hypothetical protein
MRELISAMKSFISLALSLKKVFEAKSLIIKSEVVIM